VLIGLICVAGICAAVPYNDYRLQNTFLYGNHLPISGIFLLMALTLGVNSFLYRFYPHRVLRVAELAVIWSMILVGGGIASSGGMRYLLPLPAGLVYYRPSSGRWDPLIAEIPDWLLPSREASSPIILGFFEGLPPGAPVPWGAWVRPVLGWGIAFALLLLLFFCLSSLLRRQWADNERLTFPLVQLPLEMMRAPEPGRSVQSFYRNPWMWSGFCLVFLVHSLNGLHTYFPHFPAFPLRLDIGRAFPDRPWSALGIWELRIYFSIIGVTYLLATDVSLSLWFFFILLRLIRVFRASLGLDPVVPGFFGNENAWVVGAMLAWSGSMLWISLPYLIRVVRAALRGASAAESTREVLSYHAALAGVLLSFAGLLVWGHAAGIQPAYMALISGLFVVMTVVVARAVAEGGILMVQMPLIPHDALAPLLGTQWIKAGSWASGTVYQAVFMHDLREAQMPSVLHSFKLRDLTALKSIPGAPFAGALAAAVVVAFLVSAAAFLFTTYHYGAISMDPWGMRNAPRTFFNRGAQVLTSPLLPNREVALNVLGGAAAGALVSTLRLRLVWWPLHPLGLVLAGAWSTSVIWFSIFIAWCLKTLAMRYGGLRFYRLSLPFFLGLVLGEGFTAITWVIVGALTGAGAVRFLPE
jgi:uncharacterized protein DUF6785/uncharacterized protein DUF6784